MSAGSPSSIHVTGLGLVTPAGPNAAATCCALRAGIPRFAALADAWVSDPGGEPVPVNGAAIPDCVEVEPGRSRLASHARRALREALADAGLEGSKDLECRLYLGHDPECDPHSIAAGLEELLPDAPETALVPSGRCAALVGLATAVEDLAAGEIDVAIIGASASWIDPLRLILLERMGRLMTPAVPEGVLPGEAAGFVVVEAADTASKRGVRPYARVVGAGTGEEPTAGTDEPCRGEGLTAAIRAALSGGEPDGGRTHLPLVLSDHNGDHYRALEWGLVSVRTLPLLAGDPRTWEPASLIGDCGAGLGPVILAWAATALDEDPGLPEILVWGASEGRERAAVLLMPEPEKD